MSLLNKIEAVQKNTKTKSTGNAAFYNRKKNRFVSNMLHHEIQAVRLAAATDIEVSTKSLVTALQTEADPEVLKAMLMNKALPMSAILTIVKTEKVEALGADAELEEHIIKRFTDAQQKTTDSE